MMNTEQLNWDKSNGLIPAIVQNANNGSVLMLGYMNQEALQQTLQSNKVTFYSRSKQRLWQKGEQSGNYLELVDVGSDCDNDTLLIQAQPVGPTCHTGNSSCFTLSAPQPWQVLSDLEQTVNERANANDSDSYTQSLIKSGIKRIAQKVGEEGVEVALAAASGDRDELIAETADLIYHFMVLLKACDCPLAMVLLELKNRAQRLKLTL